MRETKCVRIFLCGCHGGGPGSMEEEEEEEKEEEEGEVMYWTGRGGRI